MVTKGKSIYGMGMLDSGMSMSLEQYVIDNEIVAAVRHSLKGIEVTDETIDLDTIMRVGPGGHLRRDGKTSSRRPAKRLTISWRTTNLNRWTRILRKKSTRS